MELTSPHSNSSVLHRRQCGGQIRKSWPRHHTGRRVHKTGLSNAYTTSVKGSTSNLVTVYSTLTTILKNGEIVNVMQCNNACKENGLPFFSSQNYVTLYLLHIYTTAWSLCVYQTYGKMEYFLTSLHLTRLNRTLGNALGNTRYFVYSNYASQF